MTSTVNIRAYANNVETSGVAQVTISELTPASLAYSQSCYAPCTKTDLSDNKVFLVLVTYPGQPYQEQTFSTGVDTTTNLRFDFTVSTIGTLTVYGHWDGQEVPVSFTVDGVGGPWTTNIQLDLDEGDYTVRGHYLQQDKVYSVHVATGQNTDLIIQMDFSAYGHVTVECSMAGQPVPAHVDITDASGATIYSMDLPAINGAGVFLLLPATYHIHATYAGQATDADVTISTGGEGHLVTLTFLPTYTLSITSTTGGTTTPSGNQIALEGHTITVTATAQANYDFSGWTLDGADGGTENPKTIMMNSNHTLVANFKSTSGDGGINIGIVLIVAGTVILAGVGGYALWSRRKKNR